MTLDGFLTFLTLAVAIYALVPPVTRLRAKLGFPVQFVIATSALLLVLYFEFFGLVGQPCPSGLGAVCRILELPPGRSQAPQQLAFLVVLLWMLVAWTVHRISKPGPRTLPSMNKLVNDLVYERQFAEALKLVEPSLSLVECAAKRRLRLQRWHDYVEAIRAKRHRFYTLISGSVYDAERIEAAWGWMPARLRRVIGGLSALIPAQRRAEDAAKDIVRVLFNSQELRVYISKIRPYFALALLRVDLFGRHDFSDAYFTALISDQHSVLYEELIQNQNSSSRDGYYIPKSNRLLHFLFDDPDVAKQLDVYRPIAEHLLKLTRQDEHPEFVSLLNKGAQDFHDEQWKNPMFVGMFFFDVMVSAAAHKGVEWHMWLYYFPHFVERLVDTYDTSDPSVKDDDEFPTRGARLIYEAIDLLGRWVALISYLPEGAHHRRIQPVDVAQGDNGNIPVSAARALGSCMATIASSSSISHDFAEYIHYSILRRIEGLGQEGDPGALRSYLIQSVVKGGQRTVDHTYGQKLARFWREADHVLCSTLGDYEAALKAEYPGAIVPARALTARPLSS